MLAFKWLLLLCAWNSLTSATDPTQRLRSFHQVQTFKLLEALAGSSHKISEECSDSIAKVIAGVSAKPFKEYALRMLDANGKFSSGILQGNVHAVGDFDECISIQGDGFIGSFMTAQFPLTLNLDSNMGDIKQLMQKITEAIPVVPANLFWRHEDYNMNWTMVGIKKDEYWIQDLLLATTLQPVYLGLCLPSTCNAEDAETALGNILDDTVDSITSGEVKTSPFKYVVGDFVYNRDVFETSRYYAWNAGDYIAIALLATSTILGVLGSIIDYFVSDVRSSSNILVRIILCFSFYTNSQKIMAPPPKDSIAPIFGIKSISMIWVLFAHSYYLALFLTSNMNQFNYLDIYFDFPLLILFSAELAVDTFFTVGGFLMAYLFLKFLDKSGGKFNPLMMYLHRYIRLTPTYGILILLFHTLPLKITYGPFRKSVDHLVDNCDANWWMNLLYINNFVKTDENCMGESWYLAVDFQLYLITPFIVWALWKNNKWGKLAFFACMLLSAVIPAVVTAVEEYPYMVTFSHKAPTWTTHFYTKAWNRPGPYLIGILFGYILYRQDKGELQFKMKKIYLLVGWIISTATGLTLMFGLYDIWPIDLSCYYEQCYSVVATSFYSAFARTAWGVIICWVIYVCVKGLGGIINGFLSWGCWAPISRISYIMYLSHVHIQTYFYASRKQTFHFDQMLMIYWFFGHLMITMFLSFGISLLFESPFIGLEKIVFGRRPKKNVVNPKDSSITTESKEIIRQRDEAANNVSQNPLCQKNNGDLPQHNSSKTDLTKVC